MNQLLDYVISLTHLYGLVHKDKVLEIHNIQNDTPATAQDMDIILQNLPPELEDNYVLVEQDYFVHEHILMHYEFAEQLKQRTGKPFYIPDKTELLRYKNNLYFEMTPQYVALRTYLTKHIFAGDERRADDLTDDIQVVCHLDFNIQEVINTFGYHHAEVESEKQIDDIMKLARDLSNNTRLWENNGHTPLELFEKYENPHLRPKVGRNDACPCGSGKKFKKCCLDK